MGFELQYFTHKFLIDHVEILGPRDDYREAKKKAELRYQSRPLPPNMDTRLDLTNTMLCLWKDDLLRLVGEISSRQTEYAKNPNGLFTSQSAYSYYERQGKRAKRGSPSYFEYGVRREDGAKMYKMNHLQRVL